MLYSGRKMTFLKSMVQEVGFVYVSCLWQLPRFMHSYIEQYMVRVVEPLFVCLHPPFMLLFCMQYLLALIVLKHTKMKFINGTCASYAWKTYYPGSLEMMDHWLYCFITRKPEKQLCYQCPTTAIFFFPS